MNDAGQTIRHYLAIARRRWFIIVQAAIVVGVVAGLFAVRAESPPFQSTATLLVRDDISESDRWRAADLILERRRQELLDPAVLQAAAAVVPGETPESLRAAVSTSVNKDEGTVSVTVQAADADRPRPIADAIVTAYLADQTVRVTAALRQSLAETETQAEVLVTRLAEIDRANPGLSAGGSGDPSNPANAQREAVLAQLNTVYTSLEATKRQIATVDPGVEVLFSAGDASQAPKPSPVKRGLAGAFAGLLVGIALAALREVFDTRLADGDAIRGELPWPVLAEIFPADAKNTSPLVAHDQPTGQVAEAMRGLRTNLRFVGGEEPIKSIVVTSAQPGDGKTFVAANLAVSYAQMGLRTIVVSADMRRPKLDSYFAAQASPGLSDALTGDGLTGGEDTTADAVDPGEWAPMRRLEQLLRFTGIPNLWLLPTGPIPPNPAELLATESARKVFSQLAQLGEVIVIDAPPLVVVDPVLLGSHADGVLLVSSVSHAQREPVRIARERIEASNERVLGLVLNRVKPKHSSYDYYSYASDPVPSADQTA